jgi:hypothetical protein
MSQDKSIVKQAIKTVFHLPFFVDVEYSREWSGGQKKIRRTKSSKKESEIDRGRFVFLRYRISEWVDSGYDYKWRLITIWISSFEGDYLDRLERVIYHLPDSFANPVREKTNRDEKFYTSTAAYGDFNVSAEVYLKNKEQPLIINTLINVDTDLAMSDKPLE